MPRDLTDEVDRLRQVVSLAAETAGVARVTLHLRRPGLDGWVAAASTDPDMMPRPARPVRLSDQAISRVLGSAGPVVVREGIDRRPWVLVRLVDWAGEPFGILAFDQGGEPAASQRRTLTSVAALVGQAVASLTHATELGRANSSLRARAEVERTLAGVVQRGGGLAAVVQECAALTGKLVALFDHSGRQLTSAHGGSGPVVRLPGIHEILARRGPVSADASEAFIVPAGPGGLSRRKIVAPVTAGGESFGWLVIDEHPSGFRALDRFVAERAVAHLAAEFQVQRRVARVAWNAKTSLARQLVRGTQANQDLLASAEYLGVDTTARRVLAYILDPGRGRPDESLDQQLAAAVEHSLGVEVLGTRGSEGMLLLIEAPQDRGAMTLVNEVKSALEDATGAWCTPDVIVGISTVCEPTALSRGYREAREVVHCIDRFAGRSEQRVLAVDDLGPARLFLANSDTSAIRHYVSDVLGPLLTGEPGVTDLLATLHCYFDASRSVRASAALLGVHENTIRLRLARVTAATGLDVAGDANDQLSVQTALLVLRLQGHPTLPRFGAGASAAPDAARQVEAGRQVAEPGHSGTTERRTA